MKPLSDIAADAYEVIVPRAGLDFVLRGQYPPALTSWTEPVRIWNEGKDTSEGLTTGMKLLDEEADRGSSATREGCRSAND